MKITTINKSLAAVCNSTIITAGIILLLSGCAADTQPPETASSSIVEPSSDSRTSSSSLSSASSSSDDSDALESAVFEEDSEALCAAQGVIEVEHSGFQGSGYFNSANTTGANMTWRVYVPVAGTFSVIWRFANGGTQARSAELMINGSLTGNLNFVPSGTWIDWTLQTTSVDLLQGENEISLSAGTALGLANIDALRIQGLAQVEPGICPEIAPSCIGSGIDATNVDLAALAACSGDSLVCIFGGEVGNYRVSLQFDASYNGVIEVFAESRRKMFESTAQHLTQGSTSQRCAEFLVDVRDPEGQPIQNVEP